MSICPVVDCPNIKPCQKHPDRPRNTPRSAGRDLPDHLRQRRRLIAENGPICERCGWTTTKDGRGLHMHHVNQHHVQLLCEDCHLAIDQHARRTPTRTRHAHHHH